MMLTADRLMNEISINIDTHPIFMVVGVAIIVISTHFSFSMRA